MKTKNLSAFYFLTGIIFIALEFNKVFWPGVAVKALIMPLLILILWVNFRNEITGIHRLMIIALVFSWAGDVTLEFSGQYEMMFMMGLLCFMATQVLYFIIFYRTPGTANNLRRLSFGIIPVYVYGAFLVYFLYDDLGDMRVPVIVYACVILTMLSGAISRLGKVSRISYYLVLSGAMLFVLSDSMIAVNKFSYPFSGSRVLIMSTYVTGQFLILMGIIKQYRKDYM
jgi:uncharacterized membrane protein YhhN